MSKETPPTVKVTELKRKPVVESEQPKYESKYEIDKDATLEYEPGVGIRFTKLLKPRKAGGSESSKDSGTRSDETPKETEPEYPKPKKENFLDLPAERRFKNGHEVMVDGKLYTVERYDGHTGDIILKDSAGILWTETQDKVYAQNPVTGEKYYDTDFGPVSESELNASHENKRAKKKEFSDKQIEMSKEATDKIKALKDKIAKLKIEEQEKLRQTAGVINKMNLEKDYERQRKELQEDIKENQAVKKKTLVSRFLNFFK